MIEILSPKSFSLNFPSLVEHEIIKDNVIQLIKQKLDTGHDIIFVTGEEEIGKTVLLSQFARKNDDSTITCFLKPVNKFTSSLENIILDIISQIAWITEKKELSSDIVCDLNNLLIYLVRLQRHSRASQIYYFILDGFEHISEDGQYLLVDFFQQLPFGFKSFKFLISEKGGHVQKLFLGQIIDNSKKLKYSDSEVLTFSLTETNLYCSDLKLKLEEVQEIHKITGGVPGKVKSIFGRLQDGIAFSDLIDKIDNFADFLNNEWSAISFSDNNTIILLSLISLEESDYSIPVICKIAALDELTVRELLGKIRFIDISGDFVQFKSNSFKKFVKRKLQANQNKIEELIIQYYLNNVGNIDSIIELPKRYDKNKKFDEVLNILNEAHFLRIIEMKESFTFIEDQTLLGINAARQLKKYFDFYRLCLLKSSISEIKQTFVWESEIEAKVEFKDFDGARALAERSLIKEDRFRLLVFLAKKKKEKGLEVEKELLESINFIYIQINPNTFYNSDEIISIATNLLYILPEKAIDFLERANGAKSSDNSDIGFAKLAILLSQTGDSAKLEEHKIGSISSRIKNPKLKNLTEAISTSFLKDSVSDVLQQMGTIHSSTDKLQLGRIYIENNPQINDIEQVIEACVGILISKSDENPINASILEVLSKPLPYLEYEKANLIISQLDSFKLISKERGPTISHYKFLINLACAEVGADVENARFRFTEIYTEIMDISDMVLMTECYAYMYSKIRQFDKLCTLERLDSLETQVFKNVSDNLGKIFKFSAYQYSLTKNILNNISRCSPNEAIEFANRINVRTYRDKAHLSNSKAYLKNDFQNINLLEVKKFYQNIIDPSIKNNVTIEVLNRFGGYQGDALKDFPDIRFYIDAIKDFYYDQDKGTAYCIAFEIINKSVSKVEVFDVLKNELESFHEALDDRYFKIEIGFKFSTELLHIDRELAKNFHDKAVLEKKNLNFDSPIALTLFFNSLRLGILSLEGLMAAKSLEHKDVGRIVEYINNLPNQTNKILLIAEILLKIHKAKNYTLFQNCFEEYLKPYLNLLTSNDSIFTKGDRKDLIQEVSSVLYLYNQDTCFHLIDSLNPIFRDVCYDNICDCLFDRSAKAEDDEENSELKINFETSLSIITLIEKMSVDAFISFNIRDLKTCSVNNSFTKENLIVIKSKIQTLIANKLPDSINVKHDGYKLLSLAYLFRLSKNSAESDWTDLIQRAEALPNISDSAYLLSKISEIIPEGVKSNSKSSILLRALEKMDGIRSYRERVHRYSDIKHCMNRINSGQCKEKLRKAINESVAENSFELFDPQRSIVDFAYEMDKTFAEELIKIIDIDPARKPLSTKLKKHIKNLRLEKELMDDKVSEDINEVREFSKACGEHSLKLMQGRVAVKHIEKTVPWLEIAQKRPISESFSIFALFIENVNRRFESSGTQNRSQLRTLFDSTLRNIQMIKILSNKKREADKSEDMKDYLDLDTHLIVKEGERGKALDFIKKWTSSEVIDYVKICDPYFKAEDLSLVKEMFMLKQDIKFFILAQLENTEGGNLADLYRKKWSEICDQDPPEINVVIVGYRKENHAKIISPTHDRWYITYRSGLRVGTSFNSLGEKNSEISVMGMLEAKDVEDNIINKYLKRIELYHDNQRLTYLDFDI